MVRRGAGRQRRAMPSSVTPLAALGFTVAVTPFVVTPGVSLTLTTQSTLQDRRWARLPARWQGALPTVLDPEAAAACLTQAPQLLTRGRSPLVPLLVLAGAHAVVNSLWSEG